MAPTPQVAGPATGASFRAALTPAERSVWTILERGLLGYRFGPTTIDGVLVPFYCAELGIIVVVDGDQTSRPLPTAGRLAELKVRIARLAAGSTGRPELVAAIEGVVGRGRLWPED